MSNLETYKSKKSVDIYLELQNLFLPELTFLNMLKKELGKMKMLDIGVGAGRTTEHFAKLVKEYVGIDYSDSLIKACKNRYKNETEYRFTTCDVRDMHMFSDNQFDFVLFSFNGLDYISHEDRLVALKEIHRVTKNGAIFIFSTHNLLSLKKLYQIQFTKNPIKLMKRILKYFLIVFYNGRLNKYTDKNYAILKDGAHMFNLTNHYILPSKQIEQLNLSGFNKIQLFSIKDGKEILNTNYNKTEDAWVYYLCRVLK